MGPIRHELEEPFYRLIPVQYREWRLDTGTVSNTLMEMVKCCNILQYQVFKPSPPFRPSLQHASVPCEALDPTL